MSILVQWMQQAFPPAPTWLSADMPDLLGKVIGNAGIGREIIKELLRKNARVYLAARSPAKAREAIELVKAETGKTAAFLQLDLSDLDAVRAAAQEFKRREAGIYGFANYLVPGGKLSYPTFTDGPARRNMRRGMYAMYAQSKLAQISLSRGRGHRDCHCS